MANENPEVVTTVVTDEPEVISDTQAITTFDDVDEPVEAPTPVEPVAEEPVAETKDSLAYQHNVNICSNVDRTKPCFTKLTKAKSKLWPIMGPGKRTSTIHDNSDCWPSNDERKKNPELDRYVDMWSMAQYKQLPALNSVDYDKGLYDNILRNPTATWVQGFHNGDGREVYLNYNRVKSSANERIVSGDAVKDLVSAEIGIGTGLRIPLPHTGPHIVLSPRSTEDYLALDIQLNIDKRELGRHTLGLIYQNTNIFLVDRAMSFIASSIRAYNRVNSEDVNIYDEIKVTDFQILVWGMMCTMYPDGYPYDIPCSTGPSVCKHVEHLNLELSDMLWINTAQLTKTQKAKLSNASHKFTDEDIKIYSENSHSPFSKTVTVGNFAITLEVPSIGEYLEAGRAWIEELGEAAKDMFTGVENSEQAQQEYVNQLISIASLREYSAWIKRIVVNKTNVIEGSVDLAVALESLSKRKDIVSEILDAIQEFIENSTVAIIALPNAACPACETDFVTDEFSKHPELIPIDALKLFFELKDRRIYLQAASTIA